MSTVKAAEGRETQEIHRSGPSSQGSSGPVLRRGTMVDHFRVMRLIGRGGMGEVYLVRDTKLGRRAALKVINAEHLGSKEALESFLFEARTTARFSHPNIVMIHAVGEHQGRPYVALEYLEGQNLRERMLEQTPSLPEALRIARSVAHALEEAHANGVLHLDLKPENVVIPRDGRVRVVDFGLARTFVVADAEQPPGEVSQGPTGAGWGTPAYVAPEQWHYAECTSATDVWALGIILFELCSSKLPYPQEPALEKGKAICAKVPAPRLDEVADVPADLTELVARCLEKDPKQRPSAAEVGETIDDLLSTRRRPSKIEESPFRGLLPFTQRHADLFFGRESEVAAFVERLRHQPVLTVVGPSGAGKSSFVQAGVVPRLLEQERWRVLRLRPGAQPFYALAERIHRIEAHSSNRRPKVEAQAADSQTGTPVDDSIAIERLARNLRDHPHHLAMTLRALAEEERGKVLLLVEQIEELFTTVSDQDTRRRFMRAVCSAADDPLEPVRVILTVRDDFLGRMATGPEAREALTQVTVIQSLGAHALAEVLTRPLQAVGYTFEDPELVTEMTAAVAGQPGSLPLLQFAASLLWDQRDAERKVLLRSAYERLGGVEGALAQHADGTLDGMSPEELTVTRELLLRLVTPEQTRRVVLKERALEGLGDRAEDAFARLTQARLVLVKNPRGSAAGPTLELVHESLIHRWSTLRRWLDESREDRAVLAEITQAAELWDRRGRRPQELWTADSLRDAQRARDRGVALPELAEAFMEAGEQRHHRRRRRRRFTLAVTIGSLLAVSVGAVSVALLVADKEREARAQRDRAELQRAEAIRAAAAAALEQGDVLEARGRLRQAMEVADSPPARALWWQLQADPRRWSRNIGSLAYDVDFAPDGTRVAVACQDASIHLVDTTTREAEILRGAGDQVYAVAYAPDSETIASGTWSGEVTIWNIKTHEPIVSLRASEAAVRSLVFSRDGETLAAGASDGRVTVWDVASGSVRHQLDLDDHIESIALGPETTFVVTGSDRGLRVVDLPSGEERWTRLGQDTVFAVDVSTDGRQVAASGDDQVVRIYDAKRGEPLHTLTGHRAGVRSVKFSPDGTRLASGSYDRALRVWDLEAGGELRVYEGHTAGLEAVDWSPDAGTLVSVGRDQAIRLWTLATRTKTMTDPGHEAGVYRVAFSPDGSLLASAGGDKTIRLWDVRTGESVRALEGHTGGVDAVAFSPDGHYLASSSVDLSVRVWDVESGAERKVFSGHTGRVSAVAFDGLGRMLASAGRDGTMRLFDVESGTTLDVVQAHAGGTYGVDFSPDGRSLVSGGTDGRVSLWDVRPLRLRRSFQGHTDGVHGVSFSPDGRYLASGASDRTVRIWDLFGGPSRTLGPHGGRVYWVEFDSTGTRVGAPTSNGTATIWNVEDQSRIQLLGHQDEVNSITFSPDAELAATGADDGTVRVWDASTGQPRWHAPLLLGGPPRLFSHRGWTDLTNGREIDPRTQWSDAVERRGRTASVSSDGALLCIRTHAGDVELWDLADDRELGRLDSTQALDVLAGTTTCLAREEQAVTVLDREGKPHHLELGATIQALGRGPEGFVVAAGPEVVTLSERAEAGTRYPTGVGVTAVELTGAYLAVGFTDGNVEVRPLQAEPGPSARSFEETPAAAATRILAGPDGTLFVGYADGSLGLWNIADGTRLGHIRLHGRVVHLQLEDDRLHAATDLGRFVVWDLEAFYRDYCDLMHDVWREVPVIWQSGRAMGKAPPPGHRCAPGFEDRPQP